MKYISIIIIIFCFLNLESRAQNASKEKVLEKSKPYPRWVEGYSRGKVFKQKKGSKNTRLCGKEKAYWFVNTYETQENLKTKNGGNYYLSLDKAQRFANADRSAIFAGLISSDISTRVFEDLNISDGIAIPIQQIKNDLKASANVSNLLTVGSAWERVERNGVTFWKVHTWSSICKSDYDKLLKQSILKYSSAISQEEINNILEKIDAGKDESEVIN